MLCGSADARCDRCCASSCETSFWKRVTCVERGWAVWSVGVLAKEDFRGKKVKIYFASLNTVHLGTATQPTYQQVTEDSLFL